MAYAAPRTWSAGEVPTAAQFNQDIRDNPAFLANPPACRAYRTTAQALTTGAATAIAFDAERYDTAAMHSTSVNTSRITIVTAGLYLLTGEVSFASNVTGVREMFLQVNGATRIVDANATAVNGDSTRLGVSTVYKLAAADYVELIAYQTSGGNLNVDTIGNHSPEMSATWIGLG